jgi:uncharacterized membrane protein
VDEYPGGLLGKADAIGYAVCHQIDLRSFHLVERRLPLCARCSGMYLGAVLGLSYQWFIGWRRAGTPPWIILALLGVFVFAFVVDGLNSFISLIPDLSPISTWEYNPINNRYRDGLVMRLRFTQHSMPQSGKNQILSLR